MSNLSLQQWCVICMTLGALAFAGCAHVPPGGSDKARCARETQSLLAQPSPEHLAVASILNLWSKEESDPDLSLKYIAQAETLAPLRPEIVWIERAHCERLQCAEEAQIEDRLEKLDPENGFLWIADLQRAQAAGSQAAITEAILRIGSRSRMTFYWNEIVVLLADGLAAAEPSQDLASRGVEAFGLAAAISFVPLQPMSKACRLEQFEVPGRRAACELMFARMERSSSVLTQSLALSVQDRWWPAGSAQREALDKKRRQLDYLLTTSSRIRWWRVNRDMALRLDAARRTEREEDVELALIGAWRLPADPPANWKDPLNPG